MAAQPNHSDSSVPNLHPGREDGSHGLFWDALARLSSIVLGAQSLNSTLQQICELTKQVLPEVTEVSVTVLQDGKARTVVFTSPLAVDLDERQYDAGYGPCMDAAAFGETIQIDNTEPESPYPEFIRTAAARRITHTTSIGLPAAGNVTAALNIYLDTGQALNESELNLAQTFAGYAAVAITNATQYDSTLDQAEHLRNALQSRAGIEQAKGILMARHRCSPNDAFAMLTRASRQHNRKLRDIAAAIVNQTQT